MSTKMPSASPTLTDDNIGRLKSDRDPAADLDTQIPAQEYNNLRYELIATCDEVRRLGAGGLTGTLQASYNNGIGPATYLRLDGTRGELIIRDSSVPLGGLLLAVADSGNTYHFGFGVDGLYLPPTTPNIRSATLTAVAATSNADPTMTPLYIFDTSRAVSSVQTLADWRVLGVSAMTLSPGATPSLSFFDSTGGGGLIGMLAGLGTMQFISGSGSATLLPHGAGTGALGSGASPWGAAWARSFRATLQTPAYAGTMTVNAALGDMVQIDLTGNITSLAFSNFVAGQYLLLKFVQDNVGNRTLTGWSASARLQSPFTLTTTPGAVDVIVLASDGSLFWEVGRYQQAPPERATTTATLSNVDVTITPHSSSHYQRFSGTLSGPVQIDLSRTGAVAGDRITLEFTEGTGVTTTAVNTLALTENGVNGFATYNQSKTLRGAVTAHYTGSAWVMPLGGSLTYA